MPDPKALLRVTRIDSIGFVDKGDNPEAEITLWKRDPNAKRADTFAEQGAEDAVRHEVYDMTDRMSRALHGAVFEAEEGQDPAAIINASLDQFTAAVRAAAPGWLAGKPVREHQGAVVMAETKKEEKFDVAKLDEAARAEFKRLGDEASTLAKQVDALTAKVADLEKKVPAEPEDVLKGLTPEARKEVEAEMKKRDDALTDLRKAHEALVEQGQRDALAIRFAKGNDLEHIAGEKRLDVLLTAQKVLKADDWAELDGMLKAASKQIAEGKLFAEAGTGAEAPIGSGQAWDKIKAKAGQLVKDKAAPTFEQAVAKIARDEPGLYREYVKEQREKAQ